MAETETQTSPWDSLGRPSILYERHVFSALTHSAYNSTHPDIANTVRGGYGRDSEQYPKLWRAAVLDEHAALQSASWGAFQIVGRYYAEAGFASVEDFVTAMMTSEQRQLDAFIGYINASPSAKKALQDKNWAKFAAAYNGPAYADNSYDTKMAAAYARLAPPPPAPRPASSRSHSAMRRSLPVTTILACLGVACQTMPARSTAPDDLAAIFPVAQAPISADRTLSVVTSSGALALDSFRFSPKPAKARISTLCGAV